MAYASTYDENGPGYFDYNPSHALWYVMVELAGIDEQYLDSDSFLAAAITLFDENRGISMHIRQEGSAEDYIKQIVNHAEGVLVWGTDQYENPKLRFLLIRDDYEVASLPIVDISQIVKEPQIERLSWPETYGEVKVQYWKRVYPPSGLMYTQEVVEVLRTGFPSARYSQEVVEVVRTGDPYARYYEEVINVLTADATDVPTCIEDFVVFLWDHSPSGAELPPT